MYLKKAAGNEVKKMHYNEQWYWNDRANKTYRYKGEEFYTITPIPYYYKRRKAILSFLAKCILENKAESVCDYGCGDGEYLRLVCDKLVKKEAKNQIIRWGGMISLLKC